MTDQKELQSIQNGDLVTVKMNNGTIIQGTVLQKQNDIIALQTMTQPMLMLQVADIDSLSKTQAQQFAQPMPNYPQGMYSQQNYYPQGAYGQPMAPQQNPYQQMNGYAQPNAYPQNNFQPYPFPQGQWGMPPQGWYYQPMQPAYPQPFPPQGYVPAASGSTFVDSFYNDPTPVEHSKKALEDYFSSLEREKKMLANSAFSKFKAKQSAKDVEGMSTAADNLLEAITNSDEYYDDTTLNTLSGLMYLTAGRTNSACESFSYCGKNDLASRAAFAGELYADAGSYAAMYLCECGVDDKNIGEQFKILTESALKSSDISGLRRLVTKKNSVYMAGGTDMIMLAISYIMGKLGGMTDRGTAANLELLTSRMPSQETAAKFDKLYKEQHSSEEQPAATPETNRIDTTVGIISSNRAFAKSGTITAGDAEYRFTYANVDDKELKSALENDAPVPISVEFTLAHDKFSPNKQIPTHIVSKGFFCRKTDTSAADAILGRPKAAGFTNYQALFQQAKNLFQLNKYEDAKEVYEKMLGTKLEDEGVIGIVNCCLAIYNRNSDESLLEKALDYADRYHATIKNRAKAAIVFSQVYTKCGMHKKAKALFEEQLSLYPETRDNLDRRLDALKCIIRADYKLGNYEEVKERCTEWKKLFAQKPKTFVLNDAQLKNEIIPMLADAFYHLGDIDNAIKTAKQSSDNPRAAALLSTISREAAENAAAEAGEALDEEYLPVFSAPETTPPEPEQDTEIYEEIHDDENSEELEELLANYTDPNNFSALGLTHDAVCEKAFSFGVGMEYCTLAYLHAASHIEPFFRPLSRAAGYAYDDPCAGYTYESSQLATMYEEVSRDFPAYADVLYVPALLRAAFNSRAGLDYGLPSLIESAQSIIESTAPSISDIIALLMQFREKTGSGVEQFALRADKEPAVSVNDIIRNACDYRDTKLSTIVSSEGVERIRTTLQMEFTENSALRCWLDAVCADERKRIPEIIGEITEVFIKKGRECSIDNIDPKKLENYTEKAWKNAGDRLREKGKDVDVSSDFMSSRRRNFQMNIRRIIDFVCDWSQAVCAQDNSGVDEYLSIREDLSAALAVASMQCAGDSRLNALAYTLKELTMRIEGRYDPSMRKYFYADFLRGGEIMLDENFRPEYESTFCGITDFDILSRIERHANTENPALDEMVDQIISGEPKRGNFRTLRLIKSYAAAKGLTDITSRAEFNHLGKYITHTRSRTAFSKKSFMQGLALSQSYGRLSNIDHKADMMRDCVEAWYNICTKTCDYGFFFTLMDYINSMINSSAQLLGENLKKQLEYLPNTDTSDPNNQPAFTKQTILAYINDQNYMAAEDLMNRLAHKDTMRINDFSQEPLTFLKNFYDDYNSIYSMVSDNSVSLLHSIRRKRVQAFGKDIRGGEKLLNSWIANGSQPDVKRISELLSALGWSDISITQSDGSSGTEFRVKKQPAVGKQYYSHPIAAFSSDAETVPFRVVCLFGEYNIDRLMDKFREINSVALHTIVLLDYSLQTSERKNLARKIKEEASFSRCFIVIDRVLLFYLAQHYASNTVNKMLMAAAFPFAYYQPFVPDSKSVTPPELFTGREAELQKIEDVNGVNLVYGGRQLGKSALLRQAKKNIDKNNEGSRAVYLDIKGKNVVEAARAVSQELIDEDILTPECLTDDWVQLAHSIKLRTAENYSGSGSKIPFLLLMLDEADAFINDAKSSGYQPISELKNILSAHFKFVLAGLNNLIKYDRESVISNNNGLVHLSSVKIQPFSAGDATKLLTHTLAFLGLHIKNQETVSLILSTANYFPGLIQLYGQKLLEAMKRPDYAGYNESNTPPYEVTESHIKSVLDDESFTDEIRNKLEMTLYIDRDEGGFNHVISLLIAHILNNTHSERGCTTHDIRAAAEENEIKRVTELNDIQLKELADVLCGLNVLRENDGYYNFAGTAFREILGNEQAVDNALLKYV